MPYLIYEKMSSSWNEAPKMLSLGMILNCHLTWDNYWPIDVLQLGFTSGINLNTFGSYEEINNIQNDLPSAAGGCNKAKGTCFYLGMYCTMRCMLT